MRNLCLLTKGQAAIRELACVMVDQAGNLPPMPGIFPDYRAPIVRNGSDGRELVLARWGMLSTRKAIFDAATKRADKLRAKNKAVDIDELLRMKPDAGP